MKNIKLGFIILLFSVLLSGCSMQRSADNDMDTLEQTPKSYEIYYEQSPEAAYTAEEWLATGKLQYPFALDEDISRMQTSEMYARFYVPEEALEQTDTEILLQLSALWPMTTYAFYNYPSYYIDFLTDNFNVADELAKREDLAETILKLYEDEVFFEKANFADTQEQKTYDKEANICERRIVLEEILLASDAAFEQMDEPMRARTITAVIEKIQSREKENIIGGYTLSAFCAYVSEVHENGEKSKWYDYIMTEYPDSEAAVLVETFEYSVWLR